MLEIGTGASALHRASSSSPSPDDLLAPRRAGRAGHDARAMFHAAEHTMRYARQTITSARILAGSRL